ncbi:MAG TPA: fibronectin type III domain-containing protein, partial [Thermoanaerobaculia bacterium]|nr:fibronectin type III domain-containing protein [Thermoanaerobaculia bacterium]
MRRVVLVLVLFASVAVRAQDVLSISSGSVSITKVTANPVQGIAFKVLFDSAAITSMSFTRTVAGTPLFETSHQGIGFFSYVVLFATPVNLSGQIGTLSAIGPAAVTVPLRFDPPSAMLSNQTASVVETVANGLLALTNGSISVSTSPAAPANVVATATSTSAVTVTWSAVAGANHYEVWRSVDGGGFSLIASPTGTSHNDTGRTANKTYLYRVKAVAASASPFSNTDAATTIVFTDDPPVLVKAIHITELRTAVNAMRAS